MKNLKLIEKWVPAGTEAGQRALATGDATVAVFNPEDHPAFEPRHWNLQKEKPNCLGYALNANAEIDPGFLMTSAFNRVSGLYDAIPFPEFQQRVRDNLARDGIEPAGDSLYRPGHYLIALLFADEQKAGRRDYHFMRMDANGRWSQMNGGSRFVSWTDDGDEPLLNPATAMLGPMQFDGFYHVPAGGHDALVAQRNAQMAAQARLPPGSLSMATPHA